MKDQVLYPWIRKFLTLGSYEDDPGFRELLRSMAQQGLLVYGLLGSVILIFYVSAQIYVGKNIAWTYVGLDAQTDLPMLDKSLILLFCLAMIPLSRTSLSLDWIRRLVFILVWFICLAMLLDDIGTQDVSFTTAYTTVALLVAVATVPYTGWQTALLTVTVIVSIILELAIVPGLFYMDTLEEPLELKASQLIYISVIAVLLTGMSSQIYINRYKQYRALRKTEELKEEILENEKLKDRFFANISHEFRTPLTLMLGPLNDLLENEEEGNSKTVKMDLLRLMRRNGHRLLQLINQLLDLSKIDAGNIRLNLQPVNINTLVRESTLSFVPLAERKKIDISCSIRDKPLIVRVDPQQFERVVGNLISNALKFTPEGGKVNIVVTEESPGNNIRIRVTDTGKGISEEDLPHIFDRFYQAVHAPAGFTEGTGIGLALVKEIVELHGGSIQVSSKPERGSEFVINIDNVSRIQEGIPYELDSEFQSGLKREYNAFDADFPEEHFDSGMSEEAPTVLLVDDNPDILTYLQPHLSVRYHTIVTDRSEEALELIRENQIDLVISDVMMPEPDGFQLCKTIKEHPDLNHIPVILLTARAAEENRIEGLELGADDYISKPFSASELMARVENLIELRRLLREKFSEEVRIKGKKVDVSSEDARFLQSIQSVMEEHMEDTNFGVDWLAGEVNLSSRQLQRKIRAITNLSAGGYIRMIRLERAGQLLIQHWGNVSEVAYKVGFQDPRYFSRLFKQTYGVTPTEFADKPH